MIDELPDSDESNGQYENGNHNYKNFFWKLI